MKKQSLLCIVLCLLFLFVNRQAFSQENTSEVTLSKLFSDIVVDKFDNTGETSFPVLVKPRYQTFTIQQKPDYDHNANAERLYKRASNASNFQQTFPEMAYSEKLTYADRNIFLVYGKHYNPLHIRNMAQIFSQENPAKNPSEWLFLIEGIRADSADYSIYAEIEYAAQSAQAWHIPIENIIPYYNDPQVFQELAAAVGAEKTIFYLVMFGMLVGDIQYIEGKGYDENQIRTTIDNYIKSCQAKKIPFAINKLNALFPINDEKYKQTCDECWDIHMDIRNKITKENLQRTLQRYPNAANILVYCGSDHAAVFRQ
ncbi:MAG: hypothetical protein LBU85_01510 [Treponema sp.]|jgi:hypothetical protein|nr:hypothetical protein [Treponema sp.]